MVLWRSMPKSALEGAQAHVLNATADATDEWGIVKKKQKSAQDNRLWGVIELKLLEQLWTGDRSEASGERWPARPRELHEVSDRGGQLTQLIRSKQPRPQALDASSGVLSSVV